MIWRLPANWQTTICGQCLLLYLSASEHTMCVPCTWGFCYDSAAITYTQLHVLWNLSVHGPMFVVLSQLCLFIPLPPSVPSYSSSLFFTSNSFATLFLQLGVLENSKLIVWVFVHCRRLCFVVFVKGKSFNYPFVTHSWSILKILIYPSHWISNNFKNWIEQRHANFSSCALTFAKTWP